MNELEKYARNAGMLSGKAPSLKSSEKTRYKQGQRFPYLGTETQKHTELIGELACNCFEAECQGFYEDDFYKYRDVLIRATPASNARTGEIMPDEWQSVEVISPAEMDSLMPGAYIKFGGNTWIVYKGLNLGSVIGDGIVRRCNFVINILDWYGNIVPIPASFSKMGTLSNSARITENTIIAKNYMACLMQKNELTENFAENTRFILGKTAYAMRGLNDFTREFTDDPDSIHQTTFTIERVEATDRDNLELGVADYYSFNWELRTHAQSSMTVGQEQQISVESVRNGETVSNTAEKPVSYTYSSSDTGVLTVDALGTVHAAGNGAATITVALAQNPTVKHSVSIEVAEGGESFVAFTNSPVDSINEYESCIISAALYENGAVTETPVEFTLSGPSEICYTASANGANSIRIDCFAASSRPLKIRASSGEYSAETEIMLRTG